jgi:PAT family beta-lactamase induction signal transducer AmpG
VFTAQNWNQPATVVFQLDPKLRAASSAVFEIRSGNIALSWSLTFCLLAAMFLGFGLWHQFILPRPERDRPGASGEAGRFTKEFFLTFGTYFRKPQIVVMLLFLLLYRFGEAQLMKMVVPFRFSPSLRSKRVPMKFKTRVHSWRPSSRLPIRVCKSLIYVRVVAAKRLLLRL